MEEENYTCVSVSRHMTFHFLPFLVYLSETVETFLQSCHYIVLWNFMRCGQFIWNGQFINAFCLNTWRGRSAFANRMHSKFLNADFFFLYTSPLQIYLPFSLLNKLKLSDKHLINHRHENGVLAFLNLQSVTQIIFIFRNDVYDLTEIIFLSMKPISCWEIIKILKGKNASQKRFRRVFKKGSKTVFVLKIDGR